MYMRNRTGASLEPCSTLQASCSRYDTWRHPRSKRMYQLDHFLVQRTIFLLHYRGQRRWMQHAVHCSRKSGAAARPRDFGGGSQRIRTLDPRLSLRARCVPGRHWCQRPTRESHRPPRPDGLRAKRFSGILLPSRLKAREGKGRPELFFPRS